MIQILLTATVLLLPSVCDAQRPRKTADTSFNASGYSLDRDFSAPADPVPAKTGDGTSQSRFGSDAAGITAAVKLLIAAAPDHFKSVRVESSKSSDEIFGGIEFDGRVIIERGLLAARASVTVEEGRYTYKMNLPLLRRGGNEAAAGQVQELLKLLPPLVGKNAKVSGPSEIVGILSYDMSISEENPALRVERVGSNVAIYVYPKGSQLQSR
ncbi:MAG: hypothetical protein EOP52_09395 [Sphingobacteriales bacterium]|nr:MAG: hypothetical protein EOP52_09395 [Sphingobacteriales bacterium]